MGRRLLREGVPSTDGRAVPRIPPATAASGSTTSPADPAGPVRPAARRSPPASPGERRLLSTSGGLPSPIPLKTAPQRSATGVQPVYQHEQEQPQVGVSEGWRKPNGLEKL